jgi:L-ascorbate metabolism protein UlaG (beta-lactamase superfamily)
MKIRWNGHASFTITAANGTMIVTDPYEPGGFGGGIMYEPVDDRADIAVVSHEHADHNWVKSLAGRPQVVKGSAEAKGIKFIGLSLHHDQSQGKERGRNTVFAFEVDGVRICFAGDLGHQLSPEDLKQLGKIDLLLAPVGGFFTIDAAGASQLVEAMKPKVMIPMHYKTEKCAFPIAPVDDFLKRMTMVKRLGLSELEIKPDKLPAKGPEIWVFEHAK